MGERDTEEDGFLQRWSRRKRGDGDDGGLTRRESAVADGDVSGEMDGDVAVVPVAAPLGAGRMIVEADMLYPKPPEENGDDSEADAAPEEGGREDAGDISADELKELESIDIDALDYDADFTRFMKAGVPERLRQRALRKLWTTNPILANLDGMNDYDEDFTDAALAVDVLKTAYNSKYGYMTEEEVAAQDRLGREHLYDEDGNFIGENEDTKVATASEASDESEADDEDAAKSGTTDERVAEAGGNDPNRQGAIHASDDDDDEFDDDGDSDLG